MRTQNNRQSRDVVVECFDCHATHTAQLEQASHYAVCPKCDSYNVRYYPSEYPLVQMSDEWFVRELPTYITHITNES